MCFRCLAAETACVSFLQTTMTVLFLCLLYMLACIANETPCSCSAAPPEAAVTSRRRAVRFLPAVWAACLNNAETHSLSTASHKPQLTPNCQRRRIWLGNCFFLIMYVCEKSLRREGYYCSSVIDLVCDGRNAIGPVPFSSMLSLASENPRKLNYPSPVHVGLCLVFCSPL